MTFRGEYEMFRAHDMSVEEGLNEGYLEMRHLEPANSERYDSFSAITQAGRSGESYNRTRGSSKVCRGHKKEGYKWPYLSNNPNTLS